MLTVGLIKLQGVMYNVLLGDVQMINGPDISACISHLMSSKIIGNVPQHVSDLTVKQGLFQLITLQYWKFLLQHTDTYPTQHQWVIT